MYGMYNQTSLDRINNQIAELEKMRNQMQQPIQPPTSLTQNFQIAPTNRETIKYATSLDEVQRDMVVGDTPYFSKDMSIVWIKNTKGEIKTYELTEIIPKDEKDLMIESLQMQINELKGMVNNEQHATGDDDEYDETSTTKNVEPTREPTKESKPSSIQGVPRSKKK